MYAYNINIAAHQFFEILLQAYQLKHIRWHLDAHINITRLSLLIACKRAEQAERAYIKLLDDGLSIRLDGVNAFLSCYHSEGKDTKFFRIRKGKGLKNRTRWLAVCDYLAITGISKTKVQKKS